MTRFDRDTAVRPVGEGVFAARVDPGWFIVRGPNGGYVAAMLLRALEATVNDAARAARSLTIHYTAPPGEGPVEIRTVVERRGRSLTTVSGRMLQEGKLVALALAAFSKPREAESLSEVFMPEVAPPEACPEMEKRIPVHERYEHRPAVGAQPFSGGDRAECGGWIRLRDGDRPLDAPLIAAYADAWPPALFARMSAPLAGGIPTVDLTIHFRQTPGAARSDDYALAVFRTRRAHEGFLEEDGEIWSRDGELLAQSRQLALIL